MVEIWFDGNLSARKGDIIRVLRAIREDVALRASKVENISGGGSERSHVDGTLMTVMPSDLDPPLVGRIETIDRRNGNTYVTLATGVYEQPNLFFPAGDFLGGQDALRRILRTDVRGYLKIADPYVSPATLSLLESVPVGTEIRLLCSKPDDVTGMKKKANDLNSKGYAVEIRLGKPNCGSRLPETGGASRVPESGRYAWPGTVPNSHSGPAGSPRVGAA